MSAKQGSATVVIGGQWGDEGKGKMVDTLAARHDVVVRYQGGANAGHTIRAEGQEYIFHLIPSGILLENKDCVLGPGLVVDPLTLAEEIKTLKKRGVSVDGRLFLSDSAHLILPYHRLIDRLQEESKKGRSIGTTGRGIGPAYADKVSRSGLRADLFRLEPERFKRVIIERIIEQNRKIDALYHGDPVSPNETAEKLLALKPVIEPLLVDSGDFLHEALADGKRLLLEGAQGTLLDIDHGTYPFVTSSNPSIGGAVTGSGVSPRWIGSVVGIFKAYCTRVGNGPFPTELKDELGEALRQRGAEFGATTGRPRRCGWFDLPAARYAVRLNGIDVLAVTKFDVLSGLDEIGVCTGYRLDGEPIDRFPRDPATLDRVEPVVEMLEGWREDISEAKRWEDLPAAAQRYLEFLSRGLGLPVGLLGVGPDRKQILDLQARAVA
ncbi:MAG: adenylosuccinate synthase [Candidatus Latescibacteria bacterium]|nr:adenylosuccinate synthase [Candidatus Latescibacterota bacterium]MCB9516986.1 adenylosuccinate synthase [Candidatus Latescibacterota bacterium]